MAKVDLPTGDSYIPKVEVDLPSNKDMRQNIEGGHQKAQKPDRRVAAVAKGKSVKHKESKAKKAIENFIGEDIEDVKSYIFRDIFIPAIKRGLMDIVGAVLGQSPRGYYDSRPSGTRVSYQKAYDDARRGYGRVRDPREPVSHSVFAFDDVIMDSRGDAQEVLNMMNDLLKEYGAVSVADLYDLAGISAPFTYRDWGWYDLRSASYRATRDGWLLVMPRAVSLK